MVHSEPDDGEPTGTTGSGADATVGGPEYLERLVGALPAAALVIDGVGTIRYATEATAAIVGRSTAAEMIGTSVLDYVEPDTSWAYAAAVAIATDYPDLPLGPLRITFLDGHGGERHADLWARNHVDDPVLGGIVCLLTEESCAMGLAEAVAGLASGDDLERLARRVLDALRGAPVMADATLLAPDDGGYRVVATTTGTDLVGPVTGDHHLEAPWRIAATTGIRAIHGELATLPAELAEAAAGAGYQAVWAEPVPATADEGALALVTWRRRPGNPSPNQLNSIFQAAAILGLAAGRG